MPGAFPVRMMNFTDTTASGSKTLALAAPDSPHILLGVDVVASEDEPIQCFFHIDTHLGGAFYYDSQSTGEGLGVYFAWRGMWRLYPTDNVTIFYSSSAVITWSGIAWGMVCPAGEFDGV